MQIVTQKNTKNLYVKFRKPDGSWVCRTTKTTNRQIAERIGKKIYNDEMLNTLGGRDVTISDGLKKFQESKKGTPNYRNLGFHIAWVLKNVPCDQPFSKIDTVFVEELKATRSDGRAPATVQHTINLLRGAHDYLRKLGYDVSPIEWPSIKINNQRQRYLSAEEEQAFLDALSPDRLWAKMPQDRKELQPYQLDGMQQNYDIGVALLDTGGRLNEVIGMEWRNIDIKNKTVMLWRSKTNSGTTLVLTDRLFEIIKRRHANRKSDQWVFPGAGDGPCVSACQRIRTALKRAGLKGVRIHDLRHTLASKLINNGMSLYEVASQLGHSSPSTTARYAHLERRDVALKAAKVLNNLNELNGEAV